MIDPGDAPTALPPSTLARKLAHDIRSPLGVITGVLDDLGRGGAAGSTSPMLALASRSSRRLEWLARRMQWLAHATADLGSDASDTKLPLSEIAARAAQSSESIAGRRGITVEVATDAAGDPEVGPAPLWMHACEELIHNALRHARTKVIVRHGERDGVATLSVEDDGIGVGSDRAADLFAAFATPSTGFGLWLCRRLLVGCGANVRHDAALQPGARFVIERGPGSP